MNKSTHEGPVQISEGIVLAVLSGFAYVEAYAYERGFAGALGIPRELIDLRWTTIFAAWAALALAAATMLAIHYLPKRNFALKTLSTVVITGVILVPTLGFSRWRLQLGLMLLVGALFVFFEIFTALLNAGLRKINRVASGQSKFEGEATVEFENKDMLVWGFRVPLWATVGVLWMVLALEFGLILGVVQADDTEEF